MFKHVQTLKSNIYLNFKNIENKLLNCQLAVACNKTCLDEDILPIYTNIYVHITVQSIRHERAQIVYKLILHIYIYIYMYQIITSE